MNFLHWNSIDTNSDAGKKRKKKQIISIQQIDKEKVKFNCEVMIISLFLLCVLLNIFISYSFLLLIVTSSRS